MAVSSLVMRRIGSALLRHCEERSDEAIQSPVQGPGLLRFARNDGESLSFRRLTMVRRCGSGTRCDADAAPASKSGLTAARRW
ncbi:hypothetical protein DY468_18550 [Rhodopseudomonas sp. BR0M22]|nr:hypothetical protein [Rhodopseudomonas sp. BR0M22]